MKLPEHIFILTNTLLKGGAEKQSLLLAAALSNDCKVRVLVYYGEQVHEDLLQMAQQYKLQVVYLKGTHLKKCIALYRVFKANKNAAVFSYLATTNVLNAVVGKLAGLRLKIGGVRSDRIVPAKFWLQKVLHNKFLTASVFNNYAGKSIIVQQGFNAQKSYVIHNCIEVPNQAELQVQPNQIFRVVSVGRFVAEKDFDTAIKAFKELKENLEKSKTAVTIKFTLIGYGPLEGQIRNLIHEEGLDPLVEVLINPPDISRHLSEGSVFLSSSLHEGLSNSILEAMASKLPIVATTVGDNAFLVKQGENGFLTAVKDSQALGKHLFYLATQPEHCLQMGQRSFELLRESFGTDRFKENYLELLQQLSSKNEL